MKNLQLHKRQQIYYNSFGADIWGVKGSVNIDVIDGEGAITDFMERIPDRSWEFAYKFLKYTKEHSDKYIDDYYEVAEGII